VAAKWPRLLPAVTDMKRSNFERSLPGQAFSVSTAEDGSAWSLSVADTAESMRGMAHVACIASYLAAGVSETGGRVFGVTQGAARIYALSVHRG
jgi:hypothetical protein